jgi:hypothetical protein
VGAELSAAVETTLFALETRYGDAAVRDGMLALWPACATETAHVKPKKQAAGSSGRSAGDGGGDGSGDGGVPWIRCVRFGLNSLPYLALSWPRPALAGLVARLASHASEAVASRAADILQQFAAGDRREGSVTGCASSRYCTLEAVAAAAIAIWTRRPAGFPPAIARLRTLLEKTCDAMTRPVVKAAVLARVNGVRSSSKLEWMIWSEAAALAATCCADAAVRVDGVQIARLCRILRRIGEASGVKGCEGSRDMEFEPLADLLERALSDIVGEKTADPHSLAKPESGDLLSLDYYAREEEAEEYAAGAGAPVGNAPYRAACWTEIVFEAGRRIVSIRPDLVRVVWRSCSTRASQLLAVVEAMRNSGATSDGPESFLARTEWRLTLNLVLSTGPPCLIEECAGGSEEFQEKEEVSGRLDATRKLVSSAVNHLQGNDALMAVAAEALGRSLRRAATGLVVLDELRPLDAARAGTFGRRKTARELLRRRAEVCAALAANGPGPDLPGPMRCAALFSLTLSSYLVHVFAASEACPVIACVVDSVN